MIQNILVVNAFKMLYKGRKLNMYYGWSRDLRQVECYHTCSKKVKVDGERQRRKSEVRQGANTEIQILKDEKRASIKTVIFPDEG